MTKVTWSVYDMDADDSIGVWNSYDDAYQFWLDHIESDDTNWELFPYEETVFPVKA